MNGQKKSYFCFVVKLLETHPKDLLNQLVDKVVLPSISSVHHRTNANNTFLIFICKSIPKT